MGSYAELPTQAPSTAACPHSHHTFLLLSCPSVQLEVKGRLALHKLEHFLSELRHSRSRTGEQRARSGQGLASVPCRCIGLPAAAGLACICRQGKACAQLILAHTCCPVLCAAVTLGVLSPAEDCSPEERAALREVRPPCCPRSN